MCAVGEVAGWLATCLCTAVIIRMIADHCSTVYFLLHVLVVCRCILDVRFPMMSSNRHERLEKCSSCNLWWLGFACDQFEECLWLLMWGLSLSRSPGPCCFLLVLLVLS